MNLDRLSQAFASMLDSDNSGLAGSELRSDTTPPDFGSESSPASATSAAPGSESTAEAACEISPRTVLEAMLFVGRPDNQPLTSEQLAGLMRGVSAEEVETIIAELNARYAAEARPYEIIRDGFGYRMTLRSQFAPLRERYYGRMRRVRLSQAAIEVLALVAYNEPVTGDQIARMRGTVSGQVLRHLVRRQLLRIERPQTKPRKAKYFTTQRFLDVFHLRNLSDLPRSEELEPR
jgi:segregation and condensation protein B